MPQNLPDLEACVQKLHARRTFSIMAFYIHYKMFLKFQERQFDLLYESWDLLSGLGEHYISSSSEYHPAV